MKVELPDYIDIDHEPEPNQTKQTISMTDQSSEQDKSLTKYKQIDDDNDDIIYQDSESEQRDTSEMGEMDLKIKFVFVNVKRIELFFK